MVPPFSKEQTHDVENPAELAKQLLIINTVKEFSDLIGCNKGQLLFILYKRPLEVNYKSFIIPKKSGGERSISAPIKGLAAIQSKLKVILEELYKPPPWVHGFTKDKSIVSNAQEHIKKRYVINLDLEDFYGAINFGRVRGTLMSRPYSIDPKVATIIAKITTLNNSLPQGASTSPVLSNMVAWGLDRKMINLAKKYHLKYTRYADDITFSSTKTTLSKNIISWEGENPITSKLILGKILKREIISAGFSVNYKKLRIQIPSVRQEVTGLTVNSFVNVRRSYIHKIRAFINSWEKRDLLEAEIYHIEHHAKTPPNIPTDELNGTYFRNVVYGHLAHLKSVRGEEDSIYINYCKKLAVLDDAPPKFIQDAKERFEMYDFFICHSSEDKDSVARPISDELTSAGKSVFFDEKDIAWGDSFIQKINNALAKSKFVIAILSKNSIKKKWPLKEINAVLAQQIASGQKKFLPLAVCDEDFKFEEILSEFPLISDLHILSWEDNATEIKDKAISLLS